MKRILFVDDEPKVLEGLKRLLYPLRNEWDMVFASGGLEALELLDRAAFDMLITDIRMPGMSGIELLQHAVKRHSDVIRIILSGTADQEFALSSATLAHQYLVKPCDVKTLRATIERAFSFAVVLEQPTLKQLVSNINTLPSVPSSYGRLLRALRNPDVSLQEVGEIIASDLGMTVKILQLVNSAFFGLRRHICNPSEAVLFLGVDTVRALTLTVSAFSQFRTNGHFSLEDLQNHSLQVGTLARRIAVAVGLPKAAVEDCFTGGLLHDVGKLVLSANYPEKYSHSLRIAREQHLTQTQAEIQVLGASHAALGGYLLWLWGLPDPVIEAVVRHHDLADSAAMADPATIACVANMLIHKTDKRDVDVTALGAVCSPHDLTQWQQFAHEILSAE